ncbi:MAG TPA: 3-isopropylmalate dehydratase small subunit [Candidatus Limnocylindria bacterium]|nr:3-isopropylmalate dehydratase small subunit [Candidatus Limnocylindria bacterium]
MEDSRRVVISGPAIAVRGNDIDTDRIIPARFLKCVVFDGLGAHAFADDRAQLRERGHLHPFDDPRFAEARILLVNRNFGCGSSREHAPQAIMRWGRGIRAIVGESFAEIFAGNCLALGIPCPTARPEDLAALMAACERDPSLEFRLDLEAMTLAAGGLTAPLSMAPGPRSQLLAGTWDSTAELLAARDAIAATAARLPYLGNWR